jgi:TRAP-type mannitol/chloroaromatic compound transport system permease small subunit
MEKVFRFIDVISEWTGKLASFLMAGLVVAICYDVALRYVFNQPTAWGFEITYMVYGAYAMLGVAYCEKFKAHVRMDMIYAKLSPRAKAWVDVVCYLLLFFPFLIVLTYKCADHTLWSLQAGERSSVSVWRPALGPFKLIITFGFILFIFQGLVNFLRALRVAVKGGAHES